MPQSKTPHLRFKGFSGEWEVKELGSIGSVVMNKRIFKNQTSEIGDIPFYKIGTFGGKPDAFISRALFEEYKAKYPYPKKGDLLISASGSIGRVVEYSGNDEYFQDSNIVWLMHDNKIINSFLKQFYSVVKWNGLEGSTIKRLYNRNILETFISLPNQDEQTKIGDYFQRLDTLIEQKEKKYQKLKQFKTAMLSQLFPKEGEHPPALRFKGFSGEWEENKLKDIATFYNGRAYKQFELLKNGKYTVLRVGNFFTNDSWYYSDLELDDNKYCNDGDLLYAWSASFGPRIWKGGKVIYHYHIWKVENHEQVAKQFLFILLDNETAKIKRKSTNGFALLHITKETIENWSIKLPSNIEEQTKIGNYFQKLDTLIDLHHQELEKLKNTKKALLAKMFV